MGRPFSEHVAGEVWRREAEDWIGERLERTGRTITGPITQPRIRPWSTLLVVPTDSGRAWFKANCRGNAFEAHLQQVLAELVPDAVDSPLAIDADRGWMLTDDHGPSLGDSREPTEGDWVEVVTETARVQRALVEHKNRLIGAGLPDYSPATVPDRFDRLVERFQRLPAEHPSHVTTELAERLHHARPQLVDAAQRVDASPVPSTFQHGDAHPSNVFTVGRQLKLFDFGDAQWAPAFEALSVPYGWIHATQQSMWTAVSDAYREQWSDLVDGREFEALWIACGLTHAVNRSDTWWRGVKDATVDEWRAWGDAPRLHLMNVLETPA